MSPKQFFFFLASLRLSCIRNFSHMAGNQLNLADVPPFKASNWINVGKKYPKKNTPYEVLWAKEELLEIPTTARQRLPPPTLPVADFIQVKLPQQSAEIIMSKTKFWFSCDEPSTNPVTLTTRPIPPESFLEKLEQDLGQAWFDGARSIIDKRFNNATDRLPFWVIGFWKALAGLVQKQERWKTSLRWLETEEKATTDPGTIQAIHNARMASEVLPCDVLLLGNHRSIDLAKFLSREWLWDQHIDMLMHGLADQVAADQDLKKKVVIAPIQFSIQITATSKSKTYTIDTATLLCRYQKHLKENDIEKLYFPVNINEIHWIAGLINFEKKEISFGKFLFNYTHAVPNNAIGDPMVPPDGKITLPPGFLQSLEKWLRTVSACQFKYTGNTMVHGRQHDSFSCGIILANTVLAGATGAPIWDTRQSISE